MLEFIIILILIITIPIWIAITATGLYFFAVTLYYITAMICMALITILNKIFNKPVHDITKSIYKEYKNKFYIHPAATKFHHTYI